MTRAAGAQAARRLKPGNIITFSRGADGVLVIGGRQPRPGESKAARVGAPRKAPPAKRPKPPAGSGGDAEQPAKKRLRPARPPNPPNPKPPGGEGGTPSKPRASGGGGRGHPRTSGQGLEGPGEAQGRLRGGLASGRGPRGIVELPQADGVFRAHPDGLTDAMKHGKVLAQARAAFPVVVKVTAYEGLADLR